MDEKEFGKVSKRNQIFLGVVGIVTLLVAVVGATFAYFSASGVSGNSATNNIQAVTAKYGALTVTYPENSTIDLGIVDLPQGGDDARGIMKFMVASDASANIDTSFNIRWAGTASITNDFCQYAKPNNTCSDVPGFMCYGGSATGAENQTECGSVAGATWTAFTEVKAEINYTLYSCTLAGFNAVTDTSFTNCTIINAANTPAPYTSAEKTADLVGLQTIDISESLTNYYVLLLTIENNVGTQDYNQGKTFSGAISIVASN